MRNRRRRRGYVAYYASQLGFFAISRSSILPSVNFAQGLFLSRKHGPRRISVCYEGRDRFCRIGRDSKSIPRSFSERAPQEVLRMSYSISTRFRRSTRTLPPITSRRARRGREELPEHQPGDDGEQSPRSFTNNEWPILMKKVGGFTRLGPFILSGFERGYVEELYRCEVDGEEVRLKLPGPDGSVSIRHSAGTIRASLRAGVFLIFSARPPLSISAARAAGERRSSQCFRLIQAPPPTAARVTMAPGLGRGG